MIKKILVWGSALCALTVFFLAIFPLYLWIEMRSVVSPLHITWDVIEISSSQYALEAHYSFMSEDTMYAGTSRLSKPYYYNEESARKVAEKKKKEDVVLFYSKNKPEHSSLERKFPLKQVARLVVVLAVFFYFFCLDVFFSKYAPRISK